METVPIKIIGISATATKGGNCDRGMEEALKTAASFDHVTPEFITLSDKEFMTCKHCQWCIENSKPCKYNDDATWILNKMAGADGMIWGTPVWSHTIPPYMIDIISRARFQCFFSGELRNKVLGTYVVSWFGVGEEMALMTLEALGHNYLMIPVYRGWARVSKIAFGQRPEDLLLRRAVVGDVLDHQVGRAEPLPSRRDGDPLHPVAGVPGGAVAGLGGRLVA